MENDPFYALDRATKLEVALEADPSVGVHYANGRKELKPEVLRPLKAKVIYTLFQDLKAEGEEAVAVGLIRADRHERENTNTST